jgi:hypothetical protein
MAQRALRILERAVLLQIGAQCPSHHLEGDETVGDAEPLRNRANPDP